MHEQLIVPQLCKTFLAFKRMIRFITVFITVPHLTPLMSQINLYHMAI
jgi:hypothetical protein